MTKKLLTNNAFLRNDGRKGIRNLLLIISLVECAHHVAARINRKFEDGGEVHLLNWSGCAPNDYATRMLSSLTLHPNVGGVLFVNLGCEGMKAAHFIPSIETSGRWINTLTIQEEGGTSSSISKGIELVTQALQELKKVKRVPMYFNELVVGTICGGSDACSGLSSNPAIGKAFDQLINDHTKCIFEETGELVGCDDIIIPRAADEKVAQALKDSLTRAKNYYAKMGLPSFSPGNADGGLTTIEEKSMGAYCKSGNSMISGVIAPGTYPPYPGLYLLDVVPLGDPKFGFPNINDSTEILELISCGSHTILFSTGRGSVVGSIISPVIKICSNSKTFTHMNDDMDINAGSIITGEKSLNEVGEEIIDHIKELSTGKMSKSENLGHREAVLTYKSETVNNVYTPKCEY